MALVVTVGAVWLVRIPLMNLAIRGYLDAQGINASFEGDGVSFARVELERLRLGPAKAPDLVAERAEIYLDWDGLSPRVESIVLENPVLKAKVDQSGITFGSLDIFRPEPTAEPFALPPLGLTVQNGRVNVETPYGMVAAFVETEGRLDQRFEMSLRAHATPMPGKPELLEGLVLTGTAHTGADGIRAHLEGGAASVNVAGLVDGMRTGAFRFESEFEAAADLSRLSGVLKGTAERLIHTVDTGASALELTVTLNDVRLTPDLVPTAWDGSASLSAAAARVGSLTVQRPMAEATFTGANSKGSGRWQVSTGLLEVPGVRMRAIRGSGDLTAETGSGALVIAAHGEVDIADGAIDRKERAALRALLATLDSTPLSGLASQSARTLDRAMQNFHASAPLSLTWRQGFGELVFPSGAEVNGLGGVRFVLLDQEDKPSLRVELPSGKTMVSGRASLSGPGLPKLEARIDRLSLAPGAALESSGTVVVADWTAGDSRLSLTPVTYRLVQGDGSGTVALTGNARLSGPFPGGRVEDLQLPLDVEAAWGAAGVRLVASGGCLNMRLGGLTLGDYRFGRGTIPVCPQDDKGFLWTSPEGKLTGGATAGELKLALLGADGEREGGANSDLGLSAGPVTLTVSGTADRPLARLDFRRATLRLPNAVTAESRRIEGVLRGGDAGWTGAGTMEGFSLVAANAAVRAEAKGSWRLNFANEAAPLHLTDLSGRVMDMTRKARFEPIAFTDGSVHAGGRVASMKGNVRLASTGEVLGDVSLSHDTDAGTGEALLKLTGLTFSPTLQPYMLTEAARGVVENVSGAVSGFVRARWTPEAMSTDARFDLDGLSMATGGLGPVDGVSGQLVFTDFLGLKTPPGQTVTVARVNPGVAMENGVFRFQLVGDQKLQVEQAGWPLADGELRVDPTVVALDAPVKRVTLRLADVDLEKFIGLMDLQSLRATGEVEGELPLSITRQGASIEKGYLRTKGGGTLSYTGAVPATEGNAKLAFDALKNFRFKSITVDVEGDLAGEIATGIRFEGTSQASLSPLSWFRALRTRGIPFKFNVNVRAPLRSLMSSISGVTDVGGLVRRNVEMELEKAREEKE
ncbi:intermembrane phospholipid transport protein YdbH family protein [Pedomonas sp. V897]|uniref:intermembrane phospholipid transport protein YdbH family protein n=1 Tax=Pedomonas sp. V897 TaxID=3446482 RepID=UPI003EDFFB4C